MNFLQLAKRTRQECGISGDGPAATEGQSGIYAKIIEWVKAAHEELQQLHVDWNFDWGREDCPLTPGQDVYEPVDLWGLPFKLHAKDGCFIYRADQGDRIKYWLTELPWEEFRQLRMSNVSGIPTYMALSPDKKLHFYPTPNDGLVLKLEYFKLPQVLAANTDVPRIPERYHMAIVWRAVMMWCGHDENPALFQVANGNYRELIRKMMVTELPAMRTPGALA